MQFETISIAVQAASTLVFTGTLIVLYLTYRADHERRRKQATIEYINVIQDKFRPLDLDLTDQFGEQTAINADEVDQETNMKIKQILTTIEHLCVGVNTGVYDLYIINRMSGAYFLRMQDRFRPYIVQRRQERRNDRLYCEFEKVASRIAALREISLGEGDIKYSRARN